MAFNSNMCELDANLSIIVIEISFYFFKLTSNDVLFIKNYA